MAFQPVQFQPLGNPIAEGVNQLIAARKNQRAEELARAQQLLQKQNIEADNLRADKELQLQQDQFKRTGQNQELEQMRQGAEDFQKIYDASGRDPNLARQMAQAYGYEIVDSPAGPVAVKSQPPAPQVPPQAAPQAQAPAVSPQLPPGNPTAGPGDIIPEAKVNDVSNEMGALANVPPPPQPTEAQVTAVENKDNPILAAFRMRNKRGQEFSIDPNAAKAAHEAKVQEELQIKAAAPEARAAKATEEKMRHEQWLLDHPELRNERVTIEDRDRWAKMSADARIRSMREMQENPLKVEASDRQAVSALERAHQDLTRNAQYTALVKENRTVQKVFSNIAEGTEPLQHKDAQIQLARFFREAQPTEGEMKLLYNNLGGTLDKWNQFVSKISTGDLSDEQLRQLRASAKTVKAEHDKFVNDYVNAFKARFPEGGAYGNMKNELDSLYRADLAGMGIENPPSLFPQDQQQEGPRLAAPGTARRNKATKNPITNAAKTSSLSPEDRAAVDWAKTNPHDPNAAEILRVNGL